MTYQYLVKINYLKTIAGIIFFSGFAWYSYLATNDHKDIYIEHRLIHLTPDQAPYFFWALTALFALIVGMGVLILFSALTGGKQYIEITDLDITVPKTLLKDKAVFRFSDIHRISKSKIRNATLLTIETDREKRVISSSLFSKEEFEQIQQFLWERSKFGKEKMARIQD